MEWLTPQLIIATITAIATALGSVQLQGRRSRKRERQLAAQVDSLAKWAFAANLAVWRYNDAHHPDVLMELEPLPDWLRDVGEGSE